MPTNFFQVAEHTAALRPSTLQKSQSLIQLTRTTAWSSLATSFVAFDTQIRESMSFRSPYSRGVEAASGLQTLAVSLAKELHRYRVRIQLALVPSVDVRRIRLSSGGETMYGSSSGGIRELVVMAGRWGEVFSWQDVLGDAIESIGQLETSWIPPKWSRLSLRMRKHLL